MEIDWSRIPSKPGCYLWKNNQDEVIYVGKAKNIKKRMKSYFNNSVSSRTKLLVKNTFDYDFEIAPTEIDALLLEQNLINKYNPKYNLRIKSGSTYPYIELTKGPNHTIRTSTKIKKNGSKYYGPFPHGVGSAYKLTKLLKEIYPINLCKSPGSGVPCLNYQMGLCMGQCVKKVSEEDYKPVLADLNAFLNGDTNKITKFLEEKIILYSNKLMFEEANMFKDKLFLVNNLKEKQVVIFQDGKHRDVIGWSIQKHFLSISISYIRFGNLLSTANYVFEIITDADDLLETFLFEYYQNNLIPDEIITHLENNNLKEVLEIPFFNPKIGSKKDILENTIINSKIKLENYLLNLEQEKQIYKNYLKELQSYIKINQLKNVEMIDISSFAGEEQVGSVIAFKNGRPYKNLYRKYIIKDIVEMNDYKAIEEVTYRHFRNKLINKQDLPDLLIIDGKNQIHNAIKVLKELRLDEKIFVIGLIKDERHNTKAIFTSKEEIFKLNPRSDLYILLGLMQDEVHRYVIQFHHQRVEKKLLTTSLDKYVFLTTENKNNLFAEFVSVRNIKLANEKQLAKIIGTVRAKKLLKEFEK